LDILRHNRKETQKLLGVTRDSQEKVFYKGKELDELDVQAVLLHPM
jgi:K+-sensing histidine kinase KdpD